MSGIIVVPHNPNWADEFLAAKERLSIILAGCPVLSIEHIGSTSIPDLWAKPVIDINSKYPLDLFTFPVHLMSFCSSDRISSNFKGAVPANHHS